MGELKTVSIVIDVSVEAFNCNQNISITVFKLFSLMLSNIFGINFCKVSLRLFTAQRIIIVVDSF